MTKRWLQLRAWFQRWPLFRTIVAWVILALIAFTVLGWLWGDGDFWSKNRILTNWRSSGLPSAPLDIIRVSLTTIGGIGGVGYLVIKFRERSSAESAEVAAQETSAEQRLLSAVQQLGSESPQIRIAGVYSLADVADTYRGHYKQRVVDILCGYLRTPRGEWEEAPQDPDNPTGEWKSSYVTKDAAVESTILATIRRHLINLRELDYTNPDVDQSLSDDQLWCECNFDLHGAVIAEPLDLTNAAINGNILFREVTFLKRTSIECARFAKDNSFRNATFACESTFHYATFSGNTSFRGSTFKKGVDYKGASFKKDVNYTDVIFGGRTEFEGTYFGGNVDFSRSSFAAHTLFVDVTFAAISLFSDISFNSGAVFFENCFQGRCRLSGSLFPRIHLLQECCTWG